MQEAENGRTFTVDQINECSFFFFRVDGQKLHIVDLTILMGAEKVRLQIDSTN